MKITQCDRILRHLRDYGSISPQEAISEYGIYRLASRITDLKNRGYKFNVETKKGKNRYGEPTRFAVYRLADNGNKNLINT